MKTVALVLCSMVASTAAFADAVPAAVPAFQDASLDATDQPPVVQVQGAEDEGFLEKYFPFTFRDPFFEPSIDDKMVGLYIGVLLPFGFLWSPFVFGDVKPGGDFVVDALIIALLHFLPFLALIVAWIPIIGWIIAILVWVYAIVNGFYLMPVAIINAYDRSIEAEGGAPEPRRKKKQKKRRRRRRDAQIDIEHPLLTGLAPGGASVAY